MKTFGRFEFGKTEPAETYEGEYIVLDKGYVSIFDETPTYWDIKDKGHRVAAIYLDKGQSVREIKTTEGKNEKAKRPASIRKR